jgi:glutathione S-transferase
VGCDRRHDARAALVLPSQGLAVALRCYRIPFSTNVERVALAAGHKGIEIEWIDVDPDDRSPVEAVSGQPLVPVLVAGEEVIADSPRILDWLEEQHPEPPLLPAEPAARAEVRIFCEWFNRVWKRYPNELEGQLVDQTPDPSTSVEQESANMRDAVTRFEALLADRDYLFGTFGLADVTAFPFLKYASFGLRADDDELFHRILVEHQPLAESSPLHAWARRVDAHPRS